jgi:hypothetical protein
MPGDSGPGSPPRSHRSSTRRCSRRSRRDGSDGGPGHPVASSRARTPCGSAVRAAASTSSGTSDGIGIRRPRVRGFLAAKPVVRCRRARNRDRIDTRIKGHSYPESTPKRRWPASHDSTSAWHPMRSWRICARYPHSGTTPDPRGARPWPRRCSPSSKWRAIRRCDMSSRPMPLPSVSAQPYPRRRRPVVTQVGLVGARGVDQQG